ncbi:MAG TPA: hypothetical protein VF852_01695 [Pseudolabrys sp.]
MTLGRLARCCATGPKQRQQHYSYDENVDEPAKLIEDEATEIEHEVPADEKESIEGQQDQEKHETPAFEE